MTLQNSEKYYLLELEINRGNVYLHSNTDTGCNFPTTIKTSSSIMLCKFAFQKTKLRMKFIVSIFLCFPKVSSPRLS